MRLMDLRITDPPVPQEKDGFKDLKRYFTELEDGLLTFGEFLDFAYGVITRER